MGGVKAAQKGKEMYKLEDIKPKKYPDEKPKHHSPIWFKDKVYNQWTWYLGNGGDAMFDEYERKMEGAWFIDIPGAPPELKPLAYPQNKPEQDGEYWVHDCYLDIWCRAIWDGDILSVWTANVDYFINVRLDKENELDEPLGNSEQLERENEMDVKVFMDWDNKTGDVNITKPVRLEQGDFMAVVRRYLDNFSYDVVKREPELLPCPVCGGKNTGINEYLLDEYEPICNECGIRLMTYPTRERAIEAWNTLPRKEE